MRTLAERSKVNLDLWNCLLTYQVRTMTLASTVLKKLEDLKVLRRSPDLINNVKIGQGFTAYNKTYFVIPYMGVAAILVK